MRDLTLKENGSGGELSLNESLSDLQTVTGLTNEPYIAWFGGNPTTEESDQWWGNQFVEGDNQPMESLTEITMNQTALNSRGRLTIEQAAIDDLQYLSEDNEITVEGSIVGNNKFQLSAIIKDNSTGQTENVLFVNTTRENFKTELIQ